MKHYQPGMRGGLALAHTAAPAPPEARTPAQAARPAAPGRELDGDEFVWQSSSLKRVGWSLSLVGFLLYIFVITTYRLPLGDVGMVMALVGLPFAKGPKRFPPVLVCVTLLLVWCSLGYLSTEYPELVHEELIVLGKLVLILLVAVNVLNTRSNIRLFLLAYVLFYALYPARGTIFNYLSGYTMFGRALWNFVFSNSNDLAAITMLQLSMAAGLAATERKGPLRWGAIAAVVVLPVVILMTKSRGVFLGLAVFGVLGMLGGAGGTRRLKSLLIGGVVCGAVLLIAPKDSLDRLGGLSKITDTETLDEADPEGSAEQRYKIWQVSWAIIADHPVFGVGWGAYPLANAVYSPRVDPSGLSRGKRDTHSTYFNLAAETGYPGLLIFASLVLSTVGYAEVVRRRCRKLMPKAARQLYFLEIGLLGYLIAGVFGSYSRISFLYIHLAVISVVAYACQSDLLRLRSRGRAR